MAEKKTSKKTKYTEPKGYLPKDAMKYFKEDATKKSAKKK